MDFDEYAEIMIAEARAIARRQAVNLSGNGRQIHKTELSYLHQCL